MGILGVLVLGLDYVFDMEVWVGVGVYVCGEEISLLNSLEGKCGMVWVKLLILVLEGFLGCLIVVNNLVLLVMVLWILVYGGLEYVKLGIGRFKGMILI